MKQQPALRLVSSVVVLAVLTLACQTSAIRNIFITPTPTPTITPSPTPTPTSTPTPTPTNTPTPRPTGVKVIKQLDGTTIFIDYDYGYQFVVPENWVVIPLTEDDISDAFDSVSEENSDAAEIAKMFKEMGLDIKMMGANSTRKYASAGYPTILIDYCLPAPMEGKMPMSFVTALIEDNLLEGATILSSDSEINANGVDVGITDATDKFASPDGYAVTVRIKIISFQVNEKLVLIQIMTPKQFGDEVLPPMDGIADTIELLKP